MKRYVFKEYRDKAGIGSEVMFNTKEDVINVATKEWEHLNEYDKDSYRKDAAGSFMVYEIEITEEQLKDYNDDAYEFTLNDLYVSDVKDFLS